MAEDYRVAGSTRSGRKMHVIRPDGVSSYCGAVDVRGGAKAAEVERPKRCTRSGCNENWPDYRPPGARPWVSTIDHLAEADDIEFGPADSGAPEVTP